MKKEKWLLQEIDAWQQLELVDPETSKVLKDRYEQSAKKGNNFLIIMFSIIGALLIGTGIILISAKNWYDYPVFLRTAIAFLPLVASQGLAVFVVKRKYHSVAWREAVAIFSTASVFASMALVYQIFHISDSFGLYILRCGLLSLPMIYILNAASPLIVYYWTVLNWAALNTDAKRNMLILLLLLAAGGLFVFLQRKKADARLLYMIWITVIAGFAAVIIAGISAEVYPLLVIFGYFALLLSFEELPPEMLAPFKVIGTIGSLAIIAILTYKDVWSYIIEGLDDVYGYTMIGILLLAALVFAVRTFKRDKLKFSLAVTAIALCVLCCFWENISDMGFYYPLIPAIISNIVLLGLGVGFIVHGAKNVRLLTTNTGMAAICALIVMRFFDSEMDILWRGVVFVGLGVAFLLVNLKILSVKKRQKEVVSQ